MIIDKERLRVLAEAAISTQASSEWVTHAAEFESNTTPDVVLELLSENAAKDKQLAAYAQLQKSIEERMRLSSAEHAKSIEARDSLQSERDANAILTAENDALAAEVERLRKNSERYEWLAPRLLAADFDWNESGECVLIFSWPATVGVGGNCDQNIDAALADKGGATS